MSTHAAQAPQPLRPRSVSRWLSAAVTANAVFAGMTSVGVPLTLTAHGLGKTTIAVFYVVNSFLAVAYNVWLTPALQRRNYPRAGVVGCCAAVPVGALLLAMGGGHPASLVLGGPLMMLVTTVVPICIGMAAAASTGRGTENLVAGLRSLLVVGYLVGLVAYAGITRTTLPPLVAAALVAAVSLAAAVPSAPRAAAGSATSPHDIATRSRTGRGSIVGSLVIALSLVALMKSADVLRMIYLPLYADSNGVPGQTIAALFALTAVCELALLRPLARASVRHGPSLTLVVIALSGTAAFVLVGVGGSLASVVVSQALYAVFAAGFQSVGMVLLGELLPGGVGQGASAYTAVVQIGTMLGVGAPLAVPGYSPSIFLIAAASCTVAAACALALRLRLGPPTARGAAGARPLPSVSATPRRS